MSGLVPGELQGIHESCLSHMGKGAFCRKLFPRTQRWGDFLTFSVSQEPRV